MDLNDLRKLVHGQVLEYNNIRTGSSQLCVLTYYALKKKKKE